MKNKTEIEIQESKEKDSIKKYWFMYVLHNFLVKRIFVKSSINLKNKIKALIFGAPKKILDVACGDDDLILEVCLKFNTEMCIANDLSPKLTSLMTTDDTNVTYTNFNILSKPFKENFDLVLCKNTLHHIPKKYHQELIRYLLKISNQLIVVDIENPQKSNLRALLWNYYYRIFLGDQGNDFLSFEEFTLLLKSQQHSFIVGKINTIKGNYMYGSYKKSESSVANFK